MWRHREKISAATEDQSRSGEYKVGVGGWGGLLIKIKISVNSGALGTAEEVQHEPLLKARTSPWNSCTFSPAQQNNASLPPALGPHWDGEAPPDGPTHTGRPAKGPRGLLRDGCEFWCFGSGRDERRAFQSGKLENSSVTKKSRWL